MADPGHSQDRPGIRVHGDRVSPAGQAGRPGPQGRVKLLLEGLGYGCLVLGVNRQFQAGPGLALVNLLGLGDFVAGVAGDLVAGFGPLQEGLVFLFQVGNPDPVVSGIAIDQVVLQVVARQTSLGRGN